ncbi:hypothetical protein EGI24_14600, partial [Lacihabitans sp. CS3-21]|nr:hypothetical protein [Lacihabitans sp. CS3-21]
TSLASNIIKIETGIVPTAPTISANKTSICGTEKAILTAIGCTGGTITWSGGGIGATKEVTAGTYTSTCTTSCGTSGNSNSITISVGSVPTPPTVVASKNEICGNEEITLTASNCTGTIKWSNDKTGISIKITQAGD